MIEGAITNTVNQSPSNSNTVAKPKKFFKSRNSVPDANAIVAALSDSQVAASVMGSPSNVASYYSSPVAIHQQQQHELHLQQQSNPYPEKPKRKKAVKGDSPKKLKADKPTKVEKPPKVEKVAKPSKPPKPEKLPKVSKKKSKANEKIIDAPKPTRVLSRTRRVVNYSEDQSRSPPRNSQAKISANESSAEHHNNDVVSSSIHAPEVTNNFYNPSEQHVTQQSQPYQDDLNHPGDSPSKHCGPPIVLRISKVSHSIICL